MDTIKVERLDHLGILAGVIKDWFFEGSCGVERGHVSFKYIESSLTVLLLKSK